MHHEIRIFCQDGRGAVTQLYGVGAWSGESSCFLKEAQQILFVLALPLLPTSSNATSAFWELRGINWISLGFLHCQFKTQLCYFPAFEILLLLSHVLTIWAVLYLKKNIPLLGYQERAGVNFYIQPMIPGIQLIYNYTGSGIISYLMTPKFLIVSKEFDKLDIYSCRTISHG